MSNDMQLPNLTNFAQTVDPRTVYYVGAHCNNLSTQQTRQNYTFDQSEHDILKFSTRWMIVYSCTVSWRNTLCHDRMSCLEKDIIEELFHSTCDAVNGDKKSIVMAEVRAITLTRSSRLVTN